VAQQGLQVCHHGRGMLAQVQAQQRQHARGAAQHGVGRALGHAQDERQQHAVQLLVRHRGQQRGVRVDSLRGRPLLGRQDLPRRAVAPAPAPASAARRAAAGVRAGAPCRTGTPGRRPCAAPAAPAAGSGSPAGRAPGRASLSASHRAPTLAAARPATRLRRPKLYSKRAHTAGLDDGDVHVQQLGLAVQDPGKGLQRVPPRARRQQRREVAGLRGTALSGARRSEACRRRRRAAPGRAWASASRAAALRPSGSCRRASTAPLQHSSVNASWRLRGSGARTSAAANARRKASWPSATRSAASTARCVRPSYAGSVLSTRPLSSAAWLSSTPAGRRPG